MELITMELQKNPLYVVHFFTKEIAHTQYIRQQKTTWLNPQSCKLSDNHPLEHTQRICKKASPWTANESPCIAY
jgi:hypothetical protein